jgi:hypothetical protein
MGISTWPPFASHSIGRLRTGRWYSKSSAFRLVRVCRASTSSHSAVASENETAPRNTSLGAPTNYLAQHPNDDSRFFYLILDGDWQHPDSDDLVSPLPGEVSLRNVVCKTPSVSDFDAHGMPLSEPPRIYVFELCRLLATRYRELVLGTRAERRVSVPEELTELLQLDDWTHPDVVGSVLPSQTETFRQLARVLALGDPAEYRPSTASNTHWSHRPNGGTL